ncbi:N-acetylglucosamine-6-phosphate deacetylase [Sphingobacterium sp. UT-1RO-CII-1]|uniref:N-acetylglucosamine-6-phosphate deacetylase n=1 Tax=Sphingobacterium sp. UT-1RO-CII-1 TaxID=2995225 RepID=UPI00227CA0DB|nr:N-acetylglucosamine-6-phosphate deacetylase [Sphingobacterium sp. UT-1RO-CII-1]MCY4780649.1 N-acetylglucosamine-6-phosphate deacetylase [Sphingobacterium sp. UT-1RO-CII-1]
MLTIINAQIITPFRIIKNGWLQAKGPTIVAMGDEKDKPNLKHVNEKVIDAGGLYLSPGFIDLHVHGGGGADFMDNEVDAYFTVAETHVKYGTTSMLPTTLTSDRKALLDTFAVYDEVLNASNKGVRFLGLHLEGPYFAMNQRGAQDPRYIRNPDRREYLDILKNYGHLIARWSAAPELPGALELALYLNRMGVIASIAHTDAVYDDILKAVENGYTLATHLYSGMSGMTRKDSYRYAGAIESCLLIDDIDVEIIADGVHLPEPFLKLICKIKSKDSIILTTDAMRAAGMPEGKSILGGKSTGLEVIVEDGVAKLPDRSSFAGSVATADRLIRTMVNVAEVDLSTAVQMLTLNPARIINCAKFMGTIAVGKNADLVLFDEDINVKSTIIRGKVVYRN